MNLQFSLAVLLLAINSSSAFAFTLPSPHRIASSNTQLSVKSDSSSETSNKQSRSSLLKLPKDSPNQKVGEDKKKEDEGEVFGAKFFGGSAIKEELFDAELEAQADKLSKLYPKSQSDQDGNEEDDGIYRRFFDKNAFPDEEARTIAQRLQTAINQALYIPEGENSSSIGTESIYSPTLQWNTPFSKAASSKTPLDELANALSFYKRIDIAVVAANTISGQSNSGAVQKMDVKWEISLMWPNVFESRVLISGSSIITVDSSTSSPTILSQTDKMDKGGKEGKDLIQAISSQLNPRFWDLYHVGMTPSAELMPRLTPSGDVKGGGLFSSYDLFEIPARLVLQPTVADTGGRLTREAQALPNHAFSSIIRTTGPTSQRYVPTSPVEVSIKRSKTEEGTSQSKISWNIALPPEFVSYYDEFSAGVAEEDKKEGNDPTNAYVYQERRLVATLPFGGAVQDSDVTEVRKNLYDQIVKDGLKPKLEDGRPQFFYLQNDAKACFTADGGLGMAVYDWRPKSANSNEIGIELER